MSESDSLSQSEIDKLLSSLNMELKNEEHTETSSKEGTVVSSTAYLDDLSDEEDKRGYKLYNFRRPDKFSKDHLKALQDIHDEFSRQLALILTTYLRMGVEADVVSVDQLTYDEFLRSMPSFITIGILELNPLPGQVLLGLSHDIVLSMVDRMLGGKGVCDQTVRDLTDIEEALTKRIFEKFIKTLEEAWKSIFPVKGEVVGIDNSFSFIQVASVGEIVALITIEIKICSKSSGLLSLCFPHPVLEGLLGQLSTQHIFQTKSMITSAENKDNILKRLNNSTIPIDVILGDAEISVKELIDLKVGDVLRLNSLVNDSLIINVNQLPKFLGRPGIKKNKLAINISGLVINDD